MFLQTTAVARGLNCDSRSRKGGTGHSAHQKRANNLRYLLELSEDVCVFTFGASNLPAI